ncbi:hypothetical protein JOD62_002490 [Microbacterium keratanolyticum]|uniref:hypothetical protein n=1 Tax=Microbacterium keratanolyticum TaxID=67574 RepID=UPI00195EADE7|nr:hypothetical protein [Microbacterium keratanolyticum]MBM7469942.1 hypothetical protein [Microbacterium keratanolyticum]
MAFTAAVFAAVVLAAVALAVLGVAALPMVAVVLAAGRAVVDVFAALAAADFVGVFFAAGRFADPLPFFAPCAEPGADVADDAETASVDDEAVGAPPGAPP